MPTRKSMFRGSGAVSIQADPVEVSRRVYRRFVSWLTFVSGQLELERQKRLSQGDPCWKILRYEHIIDPDYHPLPLSKMSYVRPETFERHLRYLLKECRVLALPELIGFLDRGESPPDKSVVLTFDGGFRDSFTVAAPILERYSMPATFFIPTSYLGTRNLFWEDKILTGLYLMKKAGDSFPSFGDADAEVYFSDLPPQPEDEITLTGIASLITNLRAADPAIRLDALFQIGSRLETLGSYPEVDLFMSWENLSQLAKNRNFNVASLSHGHADFTELSNEEAADDISRSLEEFSKHELVPLPYFAFPKGLLSAEVRNVCAQLDLRHSFAADPLPPPKGPIKGTAVLGRLSLFQDAAYCKDVFACRLWNIKAWGYQF